MNVLDRNRFTLELLVVRPAEAANRCNMTLLHDICNTVDHGLAVQSISAGCISSRAVEPPCRVGIGESACFLGRIDDLNTNPESKQWTMDE